MAPFYLVSYPRNTHLGDMWQWVKTDHPTGHYPAQNVVERRPKGKGGGGI
jgi:hypothetical protein